MRTYASSACASIGLLTLWSACGNVERRAGDSAAARPVTAEVVAPRPAQRPSDQTQIARQLRAPSRFTMGAFARDLGQPRMLEVAPDGALPFTDDANAWSTDPRR